LNQQWVLRQLEDALDGLDELVAGLKADPALDQALFVKWMEEVYHHLNTGWNSRNLSDDELGAVVEGGNEDWARMPSDFLLDAVGGLQYAGPSKKASDQHRGHKRPRRTKATRSRKRPGKRT